MSFKKCRNFPLFLFVIAFNLSCLNNPQHSDNQKLRIAVAANMQFAMQAIEPIFEKETGIPLDLIISSSGKLTAQIEQGAPYHLFLSANLKYPQRLFEKGFANEPPKIYAFGKLVKWSMQDSSFVNHWEKLLEKNCKKIALANPKNAPYGEQTLAVLNALGFHKKLKVKLAYGESIAQTNQFINSGAVEVGFTAKSVVLSPKMKGIGYWKEVENKYYQPIQQGIIITKFGKQNQPEASKTFLNFLNSVDAKNILIQFGYEIPKD